MFDRASKIEKVFRRYPRAPVFARLAEQLLRRGRLQRAQSLCEEGCQRFPAYPTGFIVLSRCYARQKLWEEARSALDKALRLDPDNPAGYQRLASVYRELHNDTLALKCLERAAALDPLSQSLRDELEVMSRSLRRPTQPEPTQPEPTQPEPSVEPLADQAAGTEPAPAEVVQAPEPANEPANEPAEGPAEEPVNAPVEEPAEIVVDDIVVDEPSSVLESDTVAEAEAEPFAQVAPQPEWDKPPQEVALEPEPDMVPTTELDSTPPVDAEVPENSPVLEDDVVAALGAGLFDDEDPAPVQAPVERQPAPPVVVIREPARPAGPPPPSSDAVPVEDVRPAVPEPAVPEPVVPAADPLPIELLDDPVQETAREPAEVATSQPAGAAQLTRRRGTELADLLLEFGDSTQHPEEPEHDQQQDGVVATVTLAELYVEQGYDEQALDVYRRILQIDPDNDTARRGAAALETMTAEH